MSASWFSGAPRAWLQVAVWRQGWAWVIAASLVMVTIAIQLAVVAPSREALAAIRAELSLATPRAGTATPADAGPPSLTEEQRLAQLHTQLRGSPGATAIVTEMGVLAQAQQIALPQGDYQQRAYPGTGVTQVQVIQPIKASYPQLRRYIESVLRAFPSVSLDQIEVRRDNVAQAKPSARLKWSIWLLPGESGTPPPLVLGEKP